MMTESQSSASSIELFRYGEAKTPIVVSISTFKGIRYLDIRRYYYDNTSKSTKPTPKGIALREEEFTALFDFMTNNESSLRKRFSNDLKSDELTVRVERKERVARENAKSNVNSIRTSFESWSGPHFFHTEMEKDHAVLKLNANNLVVKSVQADAQSAVDLLQKIIVSYVKAKDSLDFKGKVNADVAFDFLEIAWGKYLR